jgi:alkylation response protein AidB-like acyl-CoA dehydrogenase
LAGLLVPEAYGGAHAGVGGSMADVMVMMQAAGRALMVEPLVATAVIGATLIEADTDAARRAHLFDRLVAGDLLVALAHAEPEASASMFRVTTGARAQGDGFVLDGVKSVVLNGGQADLLFVSARTAGAPDDPQGISLFVVDPSAPGVVRRDYATLDGQRACELALDRVLLPASAMLGTLGEARGLIEHALDRGSAALCAEAVGVMETLLAHTTEYLRTRQQFGQVIGRFQALQHKAVDLLVHLEQSRSMAYLACLRADAPDRDEAARAVSAARVSMARSARAFAQTAIQLHGGIGMTDELPASHYARRLSLIEFWLGTREQHLDRYRALGDRIAATSAA